MCTGGEKQAVLRRGQAQEVVARVGFFEGLCLGNATGDLETRGWSYPLPSALLAET